jgi:ATP-dependent Lon protease
MTHQIQNFVRFCEAVVKSGAVKKISLIIGYDDEAKLAEVQEKMIELQQSLADAVSTSTRSQGVGSSSARLTSQ